MHCLRMQCLVPLLWQDVEAVTWPALWLHTLQPCSTSYHSWYFPLTIWQMVWLPLRCTQRWGQHVHWAIGGFWCPCLSLHSIWDMQLVLAVITIIFKCSPSHHQSWCCCPSHLICMTHRRSETQPVIPTIRLYMDHNPKRTWHLWCLLFYSVPAKSLTFWDYNLFVCILNNWHSNSVFWYQSGN